MIDFTNSSGNTDYAPYLSLFGGAFSATGSVLAGNASANLMRKNAAIAGTQAASENEVGAEQAELYRQHLEQTLGRQTASIGGSNVTMSGSPLRALQNTSALGERDIQQIQLNAARKSWAYGVQQEGDLYRAKQDQTAGWANGLGSLITTGARAYGQWSID